MVTMTTTMGRIRKEAQVTEKRERKGKDKIPREKTRKRTL